MASDDNVIAYTIVEGGTAQARPKLIDSLQYTYTKKSRSKKGTTWQCSVRNRNIYCNAVVTQVGQTFVRGSNLHICEPDEKKVRKLLYPEEVPVTVKREPKAKKRKAERAEDESTFPVKMFKQIHEDGIEDMMEASHSTAAEILPCASGMLQVEEITPDDWNNKDAYLDSSDGITYTLIQYGTNRAQPMLIDSLYYTYTCRGRSSKNIIWQCSKRNKTIYCKAHIRQQGSIFVRSQQPHICEPDKEKVTKLLEKQSEMGYVSTTDMFELPPSPKNKPRKVAVKKVKEEALEPADVEGDNDSNEEVEPVSGSGRAATVDIQQHLDTDVTYTLSQPEGKAARLIDSTCRVYSKKSERKDYITWQCSVRHKALYCLATVVQRGGIFNKGKQKHICQPKTKLKLPIFYPVKKNKKCQRLKLVDSQDYFYNRQKVLKKIDSVVWKCADSGWKCKCRATVGQMGNSFILGPQPHTCRPEETQNEKDKVIKSEQLNESFQQLLKTLEEDAPKRDDHAYIEPKAPSSLQKVPAATHTDLNDSDEEDNITYTIIEAGSIRCKPKLVDSNHHTYNLKSSKEPSIWQCSVRNRSIYCTAYVRQHGDRFIAGPIQHICEPKPEALSVAKIHAELREEIANHDGEISAEKIVTQAFEKHFDVETPVKQLPHFESMTRMLRQKGVLVRKKTASPSIKKMKPRKNSTTSRATISTPETTVTLSSSGDISHNDFGSAASEQQLASNSISGLEADANVIHVLNAENVLQQPDNGQQYEYYIVRDGNCPLTVSNIIQRLKQ